MKVIQFNAQNVEAFYAQLEEAKARLLVLCERQLEDRVCNDVSVVRYNMAREELKSEFPLEVIGMLDASGFINTILCEAERKWLDARKHRPSKFRANESTKGGQS